MIPYKYVPLYAMYVLAACATENTFNSTKDTTMKEKKSDTSVRSSVTNEKGCVVKNSSTDIGNIDVRADSVTNEPSSTRKNNTMEKTAGLENEFKSTVSPYVLKKKVSGLTDSHIKYDLKHSTYNYPDLYCKEISEETNNKKEETFSVSDEKEEEQYLEQNENKTVYATECVQFLDSLPFQTEELDENEWDYYDSLINN